MSDAVDNAEVMLFCISLAYKESASEDPQATVSEFALPVPFYCPAVVCRLPARMSVWCKCAIYHACASELGLVSQ